VIKEKLQEIRRKKAAQILCCFFLFIFGLILRLAYLQIDQNNEFSSLGQKNFLRTETLSPARGNLCDCNGALLAANRPVFDLYWEGSGKRSFSSKQQDILEKLGGILDLSFMQNSKFNSIKFAEKYSKRILLKSDLSFEQLCCICEQCADSSNLVITNRFKRIYPNHNLASHILGYLSRREEEYTTIGICGVEKIFQEQLKGETGYVLNVINSRGRKLAKKEQKDAQAGSDIKLTLDWRLQNIAESLFEPDAAGAFILMDPEDGAIRTMISFPNFDPNIFLEPISQDVWDSMLSYNNPLLNRVTRAIYPPASIFKLVTFAAGLEENIIKPNSEFTCRGFTKFGGRKYHCIRRWGHDNIDSKTALAHSCNIPCYEIALKIKINQLADYAYRFGLGRNTGFLLPERSGLVPTYEWKVAHKGEPWWPGETLSASIGQSYHLVTPLQMARMICGICTGFLVRPRILDEEEVDKEELEISTNTLDFLRDAMREVVKQGSAKILNKIKDFIVYAKTGTAQTSSLGTQRLFKSQLEHAWLASYFQYKDERPLVLIVLVENVGSSAPARKIAANFLKEYKKLKEKEKL
jgi:penicillin-binding protein 2